MVVLKKALRDGNEWSVNVPKDLGYEYGELGGYTVVDLTSDSSDHCDRLEFSNFRIRCKDQLMRDDCSSYLEIGESITLVFNNQQRRRILKADWEDRGEASEIRAADYSEDEYSHDYSEDYSM